MGDLEFTGERFVSSLNSAQISYEHWHRYLFASGFVAGKRVLDIACGEGYGSFCLAQTAQSVLGVDISPETIAYARQTHVHDGLSFLTGSVEAIPVAGTHCFDVIVSFETIEHVPEAAQRAFLKEVKRLLTPQGLFLLSTPNKLHYSDQPNYANPYHLKEFYLQEFKDLMHAHFQHSLFLGQKTYPVSYLWNLDQAVQTTKEHTIHLTATGFRPTVQHKTDIYDLAICTDLGSLESANSILLDLSEQLFVQSQQRLDDSPAKTRRLPAQINHSYGHEPKLSDKVFLASIIIPVFNHLEYTLQCLEAIAQNTSPELFEIILIDNASTDATPETLRTLEGDVQILRNNQNVGFARACNQGAALARGKYLVFLHNDTVPQAGWLEALIQMAEDYPAAGAIGAKVLSPDNQLLSAGHLVFSDASTWNFGQLDNPNATAYSQPCEVDYCSSTCLLVHRDAFFLLNGFDLRFSPVYYEDADLGFALRKHGFQVWYCPQSMVVHCEHATLGKTPDLEFKPYQKINQHKFAAKWGSELAQQEPSPTQSQQLPRTADRRRLPLTLSQLSSFDSVLVRIFSQTEYLHYLEKAIPQQRSSNEAAVLLGKNKTQWEVQGFCDVCERPSRFVLDWQNASPEEPNFRERLLCRGCELNNRQRLMMAYIKKQLARHTHKTKPVLYLYEQVTAFYRYAQLHLQSQAHVIGSEYLGFDFQPGRVEKGLRHEDALHLSFADASLDIICSNDVFEHVPDLQQSLREACRVLRPGGVLVFSIPFYSQSAKSTCRARLQGSEIMYLAPAQYHGNPIAAEKGSLVFHDIGWDILDFCKLAGFSQAYLEVYFDPTRGYFGSGGQVLFVAEKN